MLSFSSLVDFQSNSNWPGIGLKKEMEEKYREREREREKKIQRERERKKIQRERERKKIQRERGTMERKTTWDEQKMNNHNRKTTCGSHIHCYRVSQPLAIVTESARHL